MMNPWFAKNPMMSLWLSGANAFWGAARGHAQAAAQRQLGAWMNGGMQEAMRYWTAQWTPVAAPAPTKSRRARRKAK